MQAAGGNIPVMNKDFVHMTAHDGVERIFSHPFDQTKNLDKKSQEVHLEVSQGLRNIKTKGIRVNQPMDYKSTYMNVISPLEGHPENHREWLVQNYYGPQSVKNELNTIQYSKG